MLKKMLLENFMMKFSKCVNKYRMFFLLIFDRPYLGLCGVFPFVGDWCKSVQLIVAKIVER